MFERIRLLIFSLALCVCLALPFAPGARSQQTLGGITGTVTDTSGGVLADTSVTLIGDQTTLTRTQKTNSSGSFEFVNLPIGTYTLTFSHEGFETQKIPATDELVNRIFEAAKNSPRLLTEEELRCLCATPGTVA